MMQQFTSRDDRASCCHALALSTRGNIQGSPLMITRFAADVRLIAVRLLHSDSAEMVRCLSSRDCLRVSRPWVYISWAVWGSVAIFLLTSVLRISGWEYVTRLGGAALLVLNAFLVWRAVFNKRNWIIAASGDRMYFRLFSPYRNQVHNAEPNVLELSVEEIASIWIRTVAVFYMGPKPRVFEWLVVEPDPKTRVAVAEQYERVAPPITACDRYREWFTGWKSEEGALSTPWLLYQPALQPFMRQLAARFVNLRVAPERRLELDLIGFARKSPAEQRMLLTEVIRIRLTWACEIAVMMDRHGRRSREEARKYLADFATDAEEGTAPSQAGD
jgi:hypothetical protein